MTSKEVISGVGARYAVVIPLDSDGLPSVNVTQAAPIQGSLVQGIKTMSHSDAEPQRITHYGDDLAFAQDSLPSAEVGSFTITTAKTNLVIDSMVEGNKTVTIDNMQLRGANSDKKGNEPQVSFMAYRQALDTQKGSSTFGKLRQWNVKIYGSTRITPQSQSFEQAATDKTYQATPTPTTTTIWNQVFNESTWGQTQSEYLEGVTDYQPRFNWYLGNGTLGSFQLSHPPVDSDHLHVWIDGTLTTPSAVNVSATNPAFTLSPVPGVGKKVFVLLETTAPGNS